MKIVKLILLILIIGCILATGCVGQVKNTSVNVPNVTPVATFTAFTNLTNVSNTSNVTVTSGLKGPLRVSIGGWEADLPVFIDNQSVGMVTHDKPLDLMVVEGNHTIKVCTGLICEEENVTIQFAKPRLVNFEERLLTDVGFPNPTARIIGSYPSGDYIVINVEFINPSPKDLTMSAVVKCGYSYIESRSNSRIGSVAEGMTSAYVKAGTRVTQNVGINLASGYSYLYSIPTISDITSR
jgi:hypothetical protein